MYFADGKKKKKSCKSTSGKWIEQELENPKWENIDARGQSGIPPQLELWGI